MKEDFWSRGGEALIFSLFFIFLYLIASSLVSLFIWFIFSWSFWLILSCVTFGFIGFVLILEHFVEI